VQGGAVTRHARGFRYRDRSRTDGPCSVADLVHGKLVAKCSGSDGFALGAGTQGSVVVALEVGSEQVLCTRFGGSVAEDRGLASGRRGRFRATGAPAPGWCSLR
jgi:hypothetical protein